MDSTIARQRSAPTSAGDYTILAEGIVVRFAGRTVLNGLDLAVAPGESVSIQGRSGSGKSTLLACLLGLMDPSEGKVMVRGHAIKQLSRRQRAHLRAASIGVVFQHAELVPDLTAAENVALPLMLSDGKSHKSAFAFAEEMLGELGVAPATAARDLSGGEAQRTALARALINEPAVILADEPTGSLDAELRDRATATLYGRVKDSPTSLIVVTHDPAVAAKADRALRLQDGLLVPV